MAGRFKITEARKRLLDDGIDFIVSISNPEAWQKSRENKSMGNKGCSLIQFITKAWIVGLGDDPRLQSPLYDAATHLREAIDKKMVIDYISKSGNRPHPEHEAMEHNECAIVAYWLSGDLDPIPQFARDAMKWYKIYIECDYDWQGKAATPPQRRMDCGNYLLDCISAGEFTEGVRYFEVLAETVDGKKPRIPRLARLAYKICKSRLDDEQLGENFLKEGEKLLEQNLGDPWLNYGRSVEATRWIKAIYYDTGIAASPAEACARACTILEKSEQAGS